MERYMLLENEGDSAGLESDPFDSISVADRLEEIQRKMPTKSWFQSLVKKLNYFSSLVMLTASGLRFYEFDATKIFMDGFYLAFTVYLAIFGLLLAAAEYQFVNILKYLEFLFYESGKGFFLLFVGVLLFDPRTTADLFASILLTLVGLFNLMISWVSEKREYGDAISDIDEKKYRRRRRQREEEQRGLLEEFREGSYTESKEFASEKEFKKQARGGEKIPF